MMIPAAIGLLVLGLALLGVSAFGGGGRKTRDRRLDALKTRHGAGDVIATQLKRIDLQRGGALDGRIGQLLPNPQLLQKRLDKTGYSITLSRFATVSGGLALVVTLLLTIKGLPFLLSLFAGIIIGLGLPHMVVGKLGKRRANRFTTRFPDAIELLVRGLRSGLPITETIGVVGNELPDPVGGEFRLVADKMRIGRTMDAALQDTADRLETPEFQFFVISLAIQRETGGNLAETLSNLAEVLRKRMQMKLKIKAMSSESKASAYIIGALPFIVFAIIWFINPEYMNGFFRDQRLMIAAGAAGLWMTIGVFIMAKMIAFEI